MSGALKLLGIDPGLRSTGWGVVEMSGAKLTHLGNGTVKSDGTLSLAERLVMLETGLAHVMADFKPHEAAVETAFMARDAVAALKLGQARGIALLVPARAGISVAEYAPNKIKKSVVGAGHAGKAQIRMMVEILLPRCEIDSEHSADALATAICHAHMRGSSGRIEAALAKAEGAGRPKKASAARGLGAKRTVGSARR